MLNSKKSLILAGALLLAVAGCAKKEEAPAPAPEPAPTAPAPAPKVAAATIQGKADSTVSGTVSFSETAGGVAVAAHVEGVKPGTHGFHLHELGDCSAADFTSSGGHFNPTAAPHGAPTDAERHGGDFGNIEVGEDGSGHLELTSDMLTIAEGPNSVVGRAVILHEKADDLVSQPTGAAGARIGCGVVALQ